MLQQEKEQLPDVLKEKLNKLGIKHIVFDLDGTLIDTPLHYNMFIGDYVNHISQLSGKNPDWINRSFRKILNGLRPQFSVNPALMAETARVTALRFGQDFYSDGMQQQFISLMQVYETAPPIFDGVYDTLTRFKQTGINLAVWTHTDDYLARLKLAKNGLLQVFEENVFSFDSLGIKGVAECDYVLSRLGASVKDVIFVGDSIGSDIIPPITLGVPPELILKVETLYDQANVGNMPIGVNQIKQVSELDSAILML